MALFQRKLQTGSNAPLYTIGSNRTILVVGLGNYEERYNATRHNIGFAVVDYFAAKNSFPKWLAKKDLKAQLSMAVIGDTRVILVKPTTFMNKSGEAIAAVQRFYRIYNPSTLAVYDELAINFGQLRMRLGGSDAGHNGVKSLIAHIGEDFARLRIGIGPLHDPKMDAADFVLGKFSKTEWVTLPLILGEANSLINEFIINPDLTPETRTVL